MEKIEEKLLAIQLELKAPKNQYSSFGNYHYRSNEDILEAVKPLLKKYGVGLTLSDDVQEIGGRLFAVAKATCFLGESYRSTRGFAAIDFGKSKMDDSQKTGSASSYARKYALNGLFLIDDVKDADTDEHQKKVGQKTPEPQSTRRTSIQPGQEKKWLNPNTKDWTNAIDKKISIEKVKEHYKISKVNEEKYIKELNN